MLPLLLPKIIKGSQAAKKVEIFNNSQDENNFKVIFKSPTGSGKTLMVTEFLKNIFLDSNNNVAVIGNVLQRVV